MDQKHPWSRGRLIASGVLALVVITAILAVIFGAPILTQGQKLAETNFTYNVPATIIKINGVARADTFKYIVTVEIAEGATVETLSPSNVGHVLPPLGPGIHAVAIPDSDIVGYIDWEKSREKVANPVDSNGVKIFSYDLPDWALTKIITLSCHEEIGSSGQAELVCSEF